MGTTLGQLIIRNQRLETLRPIEYAFELATLAEDAAEAAAAHREIVIKRFQGESNSRTLMAVLFFGSEKRHGENSLLRGDNNAASIVDRLLSDLYPPDPRAVLDSLQSLERTVQDSFIALGDKIIDVQGQLTDISDLLRSPYEQRELELLEKAANALRFGMKADSPDKEDFFEDALILLQECVKNPVGRQDYDAWFRIGWLYWKNDRLSDAESAFDRARRLSSQDNNVFHQFAARHLAHIRYLQDDFEGAYRALQGVSAPDSDCELEFARYSVRTGRFQEGLEHLRCVLSSNPASVFPVADRDLEDQSDDILALCEDLRRELIQELAPELDKLSRLLEIIREVENRAGRDLNPVTPEDMPDRLRERMENESYSETHFLRVWVRDRRWALRGAFEQRILSCDFGSPDSRDTPSGRRLRDAIRELSDLGNDVAEAKQLPVEVVIARQKFAAQTLVNELGPSPTVPEALRRSREKKNRPLAGTPTWDETLLLLGADREAARVYAREFAEWNEKREQALQAADDMDAESEAEFFRLAEERERALRVEIAALKKEAESWQAARFSRSDYQDVFFALEAIEDIDRQDSEHELRSRPIDFIPTPEQPRYQPLFFTEAC